MKTYRSFEIKYISATDTRGTRVSIHDLRFDRKKIIPYNYEFDNIHQIAESYLSGIGISCLGVSETPQGYILFTTNFETQIQED